MKSAARSLLLLLICLTLPRAWSATIRGEIESIGENKREAVSLDLLETESGYVFGSDLHRSGSFGDQDAIQNYFSYAHRILLKGNLYLHLGIDYTRFDFSTTGAPVPSHLQSVAGVIGVDYMHNNDVGAFLQVKPGFYTEDDFDSASFDAPITLGRIFVLQPDRLYLFTGVNAAFLRGRFPVVPLVGLIWMPNDKWKVLGILPEPRVIYSPNDKMDFWAGGELVGGSFRTDRNNTIVPAKLNGAEVDYSEYRVGGGFIYSPCNNVSIDRRRRLLDPARVRFSSRRYPLQSRRRAVSARRVQGEVLRWIARSAARCAWGGKPRIKDRAAERSIHLLFYPPQEKHGADERNHDPGKQNDQIERVKLERGPIKIHQSKGAAKMGERK